MAENRSKNQSEKMFFIFYQNQRQIGLQLKNINSVENRSEKIFHQISVKNYYRENFPC